MAKYIADTVSKFVKDTFFVVEFSKFKAFKFDKLDISTLPITLLPKSKLCNLENSELPFIIKSPLGSFIRTSIDWMEGNDDRDLISLTLILPLFPLRLMDSSWDNFLKDSKLSILLLLRFKDVRLLAYSIPDKSEIFDELRLSVVNDSISETVIGSVVCPLPKLWLMAINKFSSLNTISSEEFKTLISDSVSDSIIVSVSDIISESMLESKLLMDKSTSVFLSYSADWFSSKDSVDSESFMDDVIGGSTISSITSLLSLGVFSVDKVESLVITSFKLFSWDCWLWFSDSIVLFVEFSSVVTSVCKVVASSVSKFNVYVGNSSAKTGVKLLTYTMERVDANNLLIFFLFKR